MQHRDEALAIARERFGYQKLRPGQREAIDSILAGRDTLVVMPTGAGKSAIYQIPAVALPGPTVVVSPLIALQKDQAETLSQQDAGGAAVVNSATAAGIRREAFENFEGGELEFLFLTPEQLARPDIIETVHSAGPSLFVVDEAHCISEWGHDFRPDYLRLGTAIEALGHPNIVALTATAGQQVREEIVERLRMRDPKVIVHGFDRPNIRLAVEAFETADDKLDALTKRVDWADKPGIVYTSTRKHSQEIADELVARGIRAFSYHGGMTAKQRSPVQEEFMSDKYDVIVATSAFGMGVDKPNVRFVYHYGAPHSIDSYYQEIGRAGRDGKPAEAILFYTTKDLAIHKFFAGGSRIGEEKVRRFVEACEQGADSDRLREITGLSKAKITRLLTRLEKNESTVETVIEDEERSHAAELERIEQMRAYADLLVCRREYLLRYFGEESAGACGNCDNCERRGSENAMSASPPGAPQ